MSTDRHIESVKYSEKLQQLPFHRKSKHVEITFMRGP